eukprot:14024541-Heterocapsa_arctica.AAC.1
MALDPEQVAVLGRESERWRFYTEDATRAREYALSLAARSGHRGRPPACPARLCVYSARWPVSARGRPPECSARRFACA